jgi:hypothetical protein
VAGFNFFFLSFHHAHSHLENNSLVLFAPIQLSTKKKKRFLGRNNIGGAFVSPSFA